MIKCSLYNSDCHFKRPHVKEFRDKGENKSRQGVGEGGAVRKDKGEINEFWGDKGLKPGF